MATIVDKKLIYKLIENGVEASLIPGFIRSLVNAYLINPEMSYCEANERLKYLGWDDIEIDYHTLQLAINSLENKGLSQLEYKSAPWYLSGFKAKNQISTY
ncbi:MAG: hypothetical protein A2328_06600 [Bdellovibrionales bacterium RIFOXYB2_FULL_36_6]|nr:MAG: hypothetical protein A2328_06600 [Bdellovibrionales bacterium RIFOXYB2_FULL_36_6]